MNIVEVSGPACPVLCLLGRSPQLIETMPHLGDLFAHYDELQEIAHEYPDEAAKADTVVARNGVDWPEWQALETARST